MKNKLIFTLGLAILMFSATTVSAQRGRNFDRQRPEPRQAALNIDNLTAEQEAKIQSLRTAQLEQRLKFRNQMDELRARKQTLMTEKNPDMNAVNAVIDQMTTLRGEMAKQAVEHRQEIRNLLTDEQRVKFDARTQQGPRQGMDRSPRGPRQDFERRSNARGRR
ncbi:MAG: Spy/CpxP family protein refolding chaperone [Bacteroides sp.]|jgi:Spy/CpxP family protein refolding chaperone|nr:Spy/CpxP family protein refolding chaperone [Bacteroides sp.]